MRPGVNGLFQTLAGSAALDRGDAPNPACTAGPPRLSTCSPAGSATGMTGLPVHLHVAGKYASMGRFGPVGLVLVIFSLSAGCIATRNYPPPNLPPSARL